MATKEENQARVAQMQAARDAAKGKPVTEPVQVFEDEVGNDLKSVPPEEKEHKDPPPSKSKRKPRKKRGE